MFEAKQKEYAKLLVEVGLNVQKGQTVLLRAPAQEAAFACLCAEAAYDAGCREVVVDFSDDALTRLRYLKADDAVFDECPRWYVDKMTTLAEAGVGSLSIRGSDPDMLRDVDLNRIRRVSQATGKGLEAYRRMQMASIIPWCGAAVPTVPWAKKVFPDMEEREAVGALWEAIFSAVRITGDGCAVTRWRAHTKRLLARCEQLNEMRLTSLHYTNSLGTDLVVGLPEGHVWMGGAEKCQAGHQFVANMPTEEIFTAPNREGVNGRVVSAMPFSMHGNVIGKFAFELVNGKIVGIEAETPEEKRLLQEAVSIDEGASYLGEVALVPYDSPIRTLGILFYNTLFDENAACHFAFGKAYPCIEGGMQMDEETLKARGVNDSVTHEDFMIGTPDLSIIGTKKDGARVPVFVDGAFAF